MTARFRLGREDLSTPGFWRDSIAEIFNSTFLLMYLTFNQITYFTWGWTPPPTHVGLVMAFIVCALVESFGHLGGCHMNPGVTLIMFFRGEISILKSMMYVVSQCLGAAAGSGIVYALTPEKHRDAFQPFQPAEELGPYRGMAMEIIISTMLFFVILGVTDPKRPTASNMPGLPIGLTVGVGIFCTMSYTGGAMNPLIALGPAIITGNFTHHWIYWAGPLLGSVVATVLYFTLSAVKHKEEKQQEGDYNEEMMNALEGLLREHQVHKKMSSEKAQCL